MSFGFFSWATPLHARRAGSRSHRGIYNINRMLHVVTLKDVPISVCGSCMDARGITAEELVAGTKRSTLEELADWTSWAEKVVVF
jgi:uncharacterized protein involved in oxidation of intracellular sulfur